jgi:hypothetical protein
MDTPLFSGHLGAFDALMITFNVILTITNAISKNLPSSGTKWLPIMTYCTFTPCTCTLWSAFVNAIGPLRRGGGVGA